MHLNLKRTLVSLVAASVALGALSSNALAADGPKMHLERADVSKYPLMKLYITYAEADGRVITGKTRDDFKLIFDSNEQGAAADVKPIEATGEPVFMVIVAQVSGAMQEVFEDQKNGIKTLIRAAGEMPGSQVALLGYAQDVKRVAELGKPSEVEAKLATLQVDTDGTEVHLLDAVRTAIDLLNAKGVPDEARKLIVVFSDGIDVAGGEKKGFTELGKRALLAGIVVDTIGFAPFEPGKLKNLNEIVKQSNGTDRNAKSAQEVTAQFGNVADELRKQYVVLFQSAIAGDGKEHVIQVVNDQGGKSIYSNNVTKICENHGPPPETKTPFWKKWWFWTFAVGLPVLLIIFIIIAMVNKGKSDGQQFEIGPDGVPVPVGGRAGMGGMGGMGMGAGAGGMGGMGAAAMGGAGGMGGSNRTIALNVGELAGKGPTIGWIVGITGKYADQTFKLKPGRTLIGTAADSDIVIDDSFMSGKHCEVRYDGSTYRIVDLGSTNGVVLNDRKVMENDLVDGDTLRLGRTEFKFKSIN